MIRYKIVEEKKNRNQLCIRCMKQININEMKLITIIESPNEKTKKFHQHLTCFNIPNRVVSPSEIIGFESLKDKNQIIQHFNSNIKNKRSKSLCE